MGNKLIMVCAVPRSGATYLCKLFEANGYTYIPLAQHMDKPIPTDGNVVIKAHYQYIPSREWFMDFAKDMQKQFSHVQWVLTSRYSSLQQAFSYERALMLDEWECYTEPKDGSQLQYDRETIIKRMGQFAFETEWWADLIPDLTDDWEYLLYEGWINSLNTLVYGKHKLFKELRYRPKDKLPIKQAANLMPIIEKFLRGE
jgi:hypothetical protein